jgi:hypothetical protein
MTKPKKAKSALNELVKSKISVDCEQKIKIGNHLRELITPVNYSEVNTFRKTRIVQTDELNFYIPEKWNR